MSTATTGGGKWEGEVGAANPEPRWEGEVKVEEVLIGDREGEEWCAGAATPPPRRREEDDTFGEEEGAWAEA